MKLSVCVFGDSVTRGVVFDSVRKRYTLLCDSFANLISNNFPVSIRNYSKFGCTVTKGLEMMQKHRSELAGFDYTVLEFGGNDCDFNWPEVSAAPERDHRPGTPPDLFEQDYIKMIDEIKQSGSRPVLLTLPPIDAKRYFAWISRGLNPRAILNWLGDVEHIYRWHESYNLAVCRIAKECCAPLIDISSAFLETKNYRDLICEDGIHPNESGHRLISSEISKTLLQYRAATA